METTLHGGATARTGLSHSAEGRHTGKTRRPRILIVSPRQGWPPFGGAKLREYHFVRALAEHADVTYVFYREDGVEPPAAKDLPFCEKLVPVPMPRRYSFGRIVRGFVGRWPLPVLNYTSAEMTRTLEDLLGAVRFDLIHFDGTHLACYAALARTHLPASRIFFDWHNIESEGMLRYAGVASSFAKSAYALVTVPRLARVERHLLQQRFCNVVCSERERAQLVAAQPEARIAVIENGVAADEFRPGPTADRRRILFVGLMAYHANIEGILWFARQVWPALRQRFPGRVLTIAGADPAPPILALRDQPDIEVTGTVADLSPYYAEAFAAIVPLHTGSGTRLKILEAMAAGTPVVSTKLGAEGLELQPGREMLIAETPHEWINAFASLEDRKFREAIIGAGRQVAAGRYDWKNIRRTIWETYEQTLMGACA